jgi:hypothetical protein
MTSSCTTTSIYIAARIRVKSEINFLSMDNIVSFRMLGLKQMYGSMGRNLFFFRTTLLQTFWRIFLIMKCESHLT